MYYCNECDTFFDEPETKSQSVPYGMGNAHFEFDVCPFCKSDDIEETENCRECGEPLTEDNNFSGLCKNCIAEDMNLATTMFDFCQDTDITNGINEFAIECLGNKGINEILREYFAEKCKEDYNCFEQQRKKFIDKFTKEIGEWITQKDS